MGDLGRRYAPRLVELGFGDLMCLLRLDDEDLEDILMHEYANNISLMLISIIAIIPLIFLIWFFHSPVLVPHLAMPKFLWPKFEPSVSKMSDFESVFAFRLFPHQFRVPDMSCFVLASQFEVMCQTTHFV
jgi:hypothetical protein